METPTVSPPLLAYAVEIHSMTCVVFAASTSQARWLAVKGYWEAYGRRKGEWPRPVARRAPEFDESRVKAVHRGRCYAPEFLRG